LDKVNKEILPSYLHPPLQVQPSLRRDAAASSGDGKGEVYTGKKQRKLAVINETGFGYEEAYYMNWLRAGRFVS